MLNSVPLSRRAYPINSKCHSPQQNSEVLFYNSQCTLYSTSKQTHALPLYRELTFSLSAHRIFIDGGEISVNISTAPKSAKRIRELYGAFCYTRGPEGSITTSQWRHRDALCSEQISVRWMQTDISNGLRGAPLI